MKDARGAAVDAGLVRRKAVAPEGFQLAGAARREAGLEPALGIADELDWWAKLGNQFCNPMSWGAGYRMSWRWRVGSVAVASSVGWRKLEPRVLTSYSCDLP